MAINVLVVDDEPDIRDLIVKILTEAGYAVAAARDGFDGIKQFRLRPADLVLADLYMPGKDGIELIQELRKEFPAVKIIAFSGGGARSSMDLLPAIRHLGADAVIYKPFEVPHLLEQCAQLLASPPKPA